MELQSKESGINNSTLPFASRGNCHPLLPNDINQRPGGILSLYMSICRTECAIHRRPLRAFLEKPVLGSVAIQYLEAIYTYCLA